MAVSDLLHQLHCELVVINGDVGGTEYGSELMLTGRNLVVACLCVDAELPEFPVQVLHVSRYPAPDGTGVDISEAEALSTFFRDGAFACAGWSVECN